MRSARTWAPRRLRVMVRIGLGALAQAAQPLNPNPGPGPIQAVGLMFAGGGSRVWAAAAGQASEPSENMSSTSRLPGRRVGRPLPPADNRPRSEIAPGHPDRHGSRRRGPAAGRGKPACPGPQEFGLSVIEAVGYRH